MLARSADERALLDGWLDYYRATVAYKCAGPSLEQTRRGVLPAVHEVADRG